mgnify:CR=1 FL=1
MKLIKIFFYLLCCLFTTILQAQEQPPIEVFSTEDYGAETQNWCVTQSEDRNIYVANNKGLLEYNGAYWKLYSTPNETIIRSVSVIDDLIYTGSNNDFGYWKKNEFGLLTYNSLSDVLGIQFVEDEDFWNIVSIDDYILFQSFSRIYIYNKLNNSYNTIDSDGIIYKLFHVNESIYFQKINEGIYKIENGGAKLVSDHPSLSENRLVNIYSKEEGLLIETENHGFYKLINNEISKWDIPANEKLSEVSVFRSIQLRDGSFILGTRSDGILHLTTDGYIDYNISVIHGLSNNTVHWVFEDEEGNIWLALENGINCINIKSPFSIYTDEKGKIGTVYTSAVCYGYLYLGTNQGLFYRPLNSQEEFKLIPGVQEAVWSLEIIDNTLFCGHDTGTSIISGAISKKVAGTVQGTWGIRTIDEHPNLLLQGSYNGLYVLAKIDDTWVLRNKIEGFDVSSRFFEIFEDHVFVGHEYKGVFKIKLDEDLTNTIKVDKVPEIGKEMYA